MSEQQVKQSFKARAARRHRSPRYIWDGNYGIIWAREIRSDPNRSSPSVRGCATPLGQTRFFFPLPMPFEEIRDCKSATALSAQ